MTENGKSDFFLTKELAQYKNERAFNEQVLEAEKERFAKELKNGLGEEIKKKLKNKKKLSFWTKIRLRLARWQTIRACKKEERRVLRSVNNGNNLY